MNIVACNVTEGMIFEVKSLDELMGLGWLKNNDFNSFSNLVFPSIGTKIIVIEKPYKCGGATIIDWKVNTADDRIFTSYWSTFRNSTKLFQGEVIETRKKLKVLSNGKYAGFDMEIDCVKPCDYLDGLGFGCIDINIKFIGEFQGAKKINTKLINMIKRSKEFKEDFLKMIFNTLEDEYKDTVHYYLDNANLTKIKNSYHEPNTIYIRTDYSNGLKYSITFCSNNIHQMRKAINNHIDKFIESNSTFSSYIEH